MTEQAARISLSAGVKKMLLTVALLASLAGVSWIRSSFDSPLLYQKDFVSGYLLAKAMLNGVNPYLPLNELGAIWMPETNFHKFHHPSPHTIAIGWLCVPFAFLPYEMAARAWLLLELGCLLGAIVMLERGLRLRWNWRIRLGAWVVALGWAPVMQELWFGQFTLILLLMLLGAWLAFQRGRDVQGGVYLGLMLTLKLTGWPIILFLLLQRRWRAVIAAGSVASLLHLAEIGVHGWGLVRDYYLRVGPMVSLHYRTHDANPSLWTFGERLFADFGNNFHAHPLWQAPGLARLLDVAVPLAVLAICLVLALRLPRFDAAFALMASISAMLNPVAWTHYLLLTIIALGLVLQRLHALGWPRVWVKRLVLISVPFCVTHPIWSLLAQAFGQAGLPNVPPTVPWVAAWLTAVPTFAVLALCWLLWRVETVAAWQEQPAPPDAVDWLPTQSAELMTP